MSHQVDFSAFQEKTQPGTEVKQVIGVASGKGGVGKSTVTALLAAAAVKKGLRTAILDADITGPSIPAMFGITERPGMAEDGCLIPPMLGADEISRTLLPGDAASSKNSASAGSLKVMSMSFLLDNPTDGVLWRGPMIAGVVKQFWTEVHWGEIDVMFVDMPPGTGDVPLTVYQSFPIRSVVLVTTPQTLVRGIVEKAMDMTKKMLVPIAGVVENMAYFTCPDCGKKHELFGPSGLPAFQEEFRIKNTLQLGMNPKLAEMADSGSLINADVTDVEPFLEKIMK